MNRETTADTTPITRGLHHLGLTVPDVEQTASFLIQQLNFRKVGEKPDYPAIFVSDGRTMLTLWQVTTEPLHPFDRHGTIGLHHFALQLENRAALKQLHHRLAGVEAVEIEFAPEPLSGTAIHHMMCHIPGGLRVEFVALPEAA
ncbi:MAG: VOC family protein [Sedimenticola sp.]|nr:VOC family protein [Sedimenticola sp.]